MGTGYIGHSLTNKEFPGWVQLFVLLPNSCQRAVVKYEANWWLLGAIWVLCGPQFYSMQMLWITKKTNFNGHSLPTRLWMEGSFEFALARNRITATTQQRIRKTSTPLTTSKVDKTNFLIGKPWLADIYIDISLSSLSIHWYIIIKWMYLYVIVITRTFV